MSHALVGVCIAVKKLRQKDFGNRTNFECCTFFWFVCLFLLLAVCEARATDPPLETPSMIFAFSLLCCLCTMFCVIHVVEIA